MPGGRGGSFHNPILNKDVKILGRLALFESSIQSINNGFIDMCRVQDIILVSIMVTS